MSESPADKPRPVHRAYTGQHIVVHYDVPRCTHVAECVRRLHDVFDPKKKPWVQPDQAAVDEVVAAVEGCPTGSLRYERQDGGPAERAPARALVRVVRDGPYYAHAAMELVDARGEPVPLGFRAALCRCGRSAQKPFCDSSHAEPERFRDPGAVQPGESAPAPPSDAALRLRAAPNGPLVVAGAFALEGARGSGVRNVSGSVALCRCGASRTKPYCDGSHAQAGFRDPA